MKPSATVFVLPRNSSIPTDPRAQSIAPDVVLMLNRGLRRLIVNIDDHPLTQQRTRQWLLFTPFDFAPAFDQALKDVIKTLPNRQLPAPQASGRLQDLPLNFGRAHVFYPEATDERLHGPPCCSMSDAVGLVRGKRARRGRAVPSPSM